MQIKDAGTTFFWFDYETFGINPKSDRPAQFAGVRTDLDLNEIDTPIMLYCKPARDRLPSPESCLITGITPQHCETHGIPEREFASCIERELAMPNTIAVGYNNIRFDDEVTRFLFWRNLIDPYAREWQNGCSRWDILDMVRAVFALRPESLEWGVHEDGSVSFKLQDLSKANGLLHEHAHDALSDVRATIGLARLIKQKQPKLFDFYLNLRNKENVRTQLSLEQKQPLLHISGMYRASQACMALVFPLAQHPTNKNEYILWDLSENPAILAELSVNEIQNRLFTRQDALPENVARLPIKTIALNKSPFIVKDLRVLNERRVAELNLDLERAHQHAKIAMQLRLPETLWANVYQREASTPSDVDEDLYRGFLSDKDRFLLNQLRFLNEEQLKTAHPHFQDARLPLLFFRYRARHFPQSLSAAEKAQWEDFCHQRLQAQLPAFYDNMALLLQNATPAEKTILEALNLWVEHQPALID